MLLMAHDTWHMLGGEELRIHGHPTETIHVLQSEVCTWCVGGCKGRPPLMLESFRIHVFRSVARHLNFSKAAQELLLTQPAVTQQIKALEEELGTPLFERGGGRITFTAGGRALLPLAEQMRSLSEEAVAAVAAAHGQQAGELALGASQTIAHYLLPGLVAGFLREQPRVQVTIRSGNSDEMLEALLSHDIQLALVEGPERRKDLHLEPFLQDHMVLVVPANHAWADKEISPAELQQEPLLTREFGSGSRRVVEQALLALGIKAKDLRVVMQFDSTEGLLSAVEAGLGITFVSRWAIRNQLALGTLKVARVTGLRLARRFSLAYPAGPEPTGSAAAFRELLHTRALQLVPQSQRGARKQRLSARQPR